MKYLVLIFDIIQTIMKQVIHEMGFESFQHALNQIFLVKNKALALYVLIPSFIGGITLFIENYIFSPRAVLYVFIGMTISEKILNTAKNIRVYNQKFNIDKFKTLVATVIAHCFLLTSSWHIAQSDMNASWLPSTTFLYFTLHNFIKCAIHLKALTNEESLLGDFAKFITKKVEDKDATD